MGIQTHIRFMILILLLSALFLCSCTSQEPVSEEVFLPEFFLSFTMQQDGLLLVLTEEQKKILRKQNQDYIDSILARFTAEDPEYSYSIEGSHLTFRYDPSIDPLLQEELLMGVSSMEAFNILLETRDGTRQLENW